VSSRRSAPALRLEPHPAPGPARLRRAVQAVAAAALALALPWPWGLPVAVAALTAEARLHRRRPSVARALWRGDGGWTLWMTGAEGPVDAELVAWQALGPWTVLRWRLPRGWAEAVWSAAALGQDTHRRLRVYLRLNNRLK